MVKALVLRQTRVLRLTRVLRQALVTTDGPLALVHSMRQALEIDRNCGAPGQTLRATLETDIFGRPNGRNERGAQIWRSGELAVRLARALIARLLLSGRASRVLPLAGALVTLGRTRRRGS